MYAELWYNGQRKEINYFYQRHWLQNSIPSQRKPQYGAQVTILSESERQLAKLQRKEIKKQQKFANEGVEEMSSSDLLGLNGDYLRARREEELLNNMSAPLVSDPVSY
jgi:spore coat protein CotF